MKRLPSPCVSTIQIVRPHSRAQDRARIVFDCRMVNDGRYFGARGVRRNPLAAESCRSNPACGTASQFDFDQWGLTPKPGDTTSIPPPPLASFLGFRSRIWALLLVFGFFVVFRCLFMGICVDCWCLGFASSAYNTFTKSARAKINVASI